MNCLFSIIIPIYCVEQYLSACVDSVLTQTYRNFEVILVDDGSPDRCPALCDEYAKKDSRVHVLHKTNGGLSDARNVGLEHSSGEYIMFLDSDDYWDDPQALERLHGRLKVTKADVLNFSYKKVYEDTLEEHLYLRAPDMPLGLTFPQQLDYLTDNGLLVASAWNKVIHRSLLADIRFENDVYSEDIVWTLDVVHKSRTIDYVCEEFHCYRQRSGSITHVPTNKRCGDLAKAILDSIERAECAEEPFRKLFRAYSAFQYGTFILVQAQARTHQGEWINRLAQYKHILKHHGRNWKLLCLRLGCAVLGFRGLCRVVRMVYRLLKR